MPTRLLCLFLISLPCPALTDHGNILLRAYTSPDPFVIDRECRKHLKNAPETLIEGCAIPQGPVCRVWATTPQNGSREAFNHEFWHCLYPEFHDG